MAMMALKIIFLVLALIWWLFWKGYSVWTAARLGHKRWFIILIIFNTMGLLDIIYLSYVAKKTPSDIGRILKEKI